MVITAAKVQLRILMKSVSTAEKEFCHDYQQELVRCEFFILWNAKNIPQQQYRHLQPPQKNR